uniref:Uncharacterized protein n=1 Tax=Rhizophora mucronata TaxID=61149 RepID=A0A2P2R3X9_RHIMU
MALLNKSNLGWDGQNYLGAATRNQIAPLNC